jgi:cytochrome c-type biogenesis protein CcmH
MNRYLVVILFSVMCSVSGWAQEARPLETNVAVEARVQQLSEELRCLVCQNQTLADSHADLALDLKREIREMVSQGMSDKAILDYLVSRYGDFVLYRPPFNVTTLLLWVGPFLLLFIGALMLFITLRKRATLTEEQLSSDELRKVNELLDVNRKG